MSREARKRSPGAPLAGSGRVGAVAAHTGRAQPPQAREGGRRLRHTGRRGREAAGRGIGATSREARKTSPGAPLAGSGRVGRLLTRGGDAMAGVVNLKHRADLRAALAHGGEAGGVVRIDRRTRGATRSPSGATARARPSSPAIAGGCGGASGAGRSGSRSWPACTASRSRAGAIRCRATATSSHGPPRGPRGRSPPPARTAVPPHCHPRRPAHGDVQVPPRPRRGHVQRRRRLDVGLRAHRPRRHAGRAPLPHPHRAGRRLAGRGGGGARPLPRMRRPVAGRGGCGCAPGWSPTPSAPRPSCSRSATSGWPGAGRGCSTTRRGSTTRGRLPRARARRCTMRCAASTTPRSRGWSRGCSTAGRACACPTGPSPRTAGCSTPWPRTLRCVRGRSRRAGSGCWRAGSGRR